METKIDYRANFATEYGQRTAGTMPVFSGFKGVEKSALSGLNSGQENSEDSSFLDIVKNAIDIINPFQHIPIVSAIYQKTTGDEMNDGAKLAGDTIYGGVIGGIASLAGIIYENVFQGGMFDDSANKTAAVASYKTAARLGQPSEINSFSSSE